MPMHNATFPFMFSVSLLEYQLVLAANRRRGGPPRHPRGQPGDAQEVPARPEGIVLTQWRVIGCHISVSIDPLFVALLIH